MFCQIHGAVGRRDGSHRSDGCGHVYNIDGRWVGLRLAELQRIPLIISIAVTAAEVQLLYGALRGRNLHALITDEAAAEGVIKLFEEDFQGERKLPALSPALIPG